MKPARIIPAAIAAVMFAGTATAAHRFVSFSGDWVPEGRTGTCYTDLRTAINAAASGDTVWMQDGYVYEEGNTGAAVASNAGYARVKIEKKKIILRSESGCVDEAAGKGATIRGAWHTASSPLGANAVRCLWLTGTGSENSVIFGIVFEGGSTGNVATHGYGGGIYSSGTGCTISNCVFRNNSAHSGGAIGKVRFALYNCVLTNNFARNTSTGAGGAIFGPTSCRDCLIASNEAYKAGGDIHWAWASGQTRPTFTNGDIVGNKAVRVVGGGGGAYFTANTAEGDRVKFTDCRISRNVTAGPGGGVNGRALFVNCEISGNIATNANQNSTGGGVSGASILDGCDILDNLAYGGGGGLNGCIVSNSVITRNISCGGGGGAASSTLVECEIVGNLASNYFTTSISLGHGGGLYGSTATRCLIANNAAWARKIRIAGCGGGAFDSNLSNCVVSNNYALSRGAAVMQNGTFKTCYNCLFVNNRSAGSQEAYNRGFIIETMSSDSAPANPAAFVNCTIATNDSGSKNAVNGPSLVNTIIWNNSASASDSAIIATNSCATYLTDAHGPGNIASDPLFANASAGDYTLLARSPCRNAGMRFDWMTDASSPRSRDLLGRERVEGTLPDMGCYEYPFGKKTILLVQ